MYSLNILPFLLNSSYRKQFWLYTFGSKEKAHLLFEIKGQLSKNQCNDTIINFYLLNQWL